MNKLVLENLSIKYKDNIIFENCNFEMNSGDVILIDGANGTGKSTLIKTILGIEKNKKIINGSIFFNDKNNIIDMNDQEILEFRSKIAYLEQKDYYDNNPFQTIRDVLEDSYMDFNNLDRLTNKDKEEVVNVFNEYIGKEHKLLLNTKVSKLSGGQQRLLSIVSSICVRKDAKLFIIDEPLNNLDVNMVVKVSNIINNIVRTNKQAIFIIVSHCKIFPFINKFLRINNKKIEQIENIICHSCYGVANEKGYYV